MAKEVSHLQGQGDAGQIQGTASLIPPGAKASATSRLLSHPPPAPPDKRKTIFCSDLITNSLRAGVESHSSLYLRTCLICLEQVWSKQWFPNTWMKAGCVSEKLQLIALQGQNDGVSGSQMVASPVCAGPPCCFQHNGDSTEEQMGMPPCAPGSAVTSLCQSPGEQEEKGCTLVMQACEASFSRRARAVSTWPSRAAMCRGVCPAVVARLGLALFSSRSFTMLVWPMRAAQ